MASGLRRVGLLRFDLLARTQPIYPENGTLAPGGLVVVEDGSIRKWGRLRCPGRCGLSIALSLNQARRPRWRVKLDCWSRPTVEPSVHQMSACGCHFCIVRSTIMWCPGKKPLCLGLDL